MSGFRGYIGSRPYRGNRVPQHVQNLVIRTYCQKHDMTYLLSATEWIMPGCYIVLNEVLSELPKIEGIVVYSLFMLPEDARRRGDVLWQVLQSGRSIHGAVEDWPIRSEEDIARTQDLWLLGSH